MADLALGRVAAVGELFDRHHESVRQFLRRACPLQADVDDLVHETFLTAMRASGSFDGRHSARAFLIGVAGQLVRRRRRSLARWTRALRDVAATFAPSIRRTPEDAASEEEQIARVESALARMTEEKRLVFLMIEREGLAAGEVANALGIPVATVWTRLHYARAELRRALSRGGFR